MQGEQQVSRLREIAHSAGDFAALEMTELNFIRGFFLTSVVKALWRQTRRKAI
jgi:hypothetical protein